MKKRFFLKAVVCIIFLSILTAGYSMASSINSVFESNFSNVFFRSSFFEMLTSIVYSSSGLTTEEDSDGNLIITGYTGSSSYVEIPETIDGKNVISIGDKAFQSNTTIKKVKISANITSIGYLSFANCTNLDEINLPNSITNFSGTGSCFLGCSSLTSINIPTSLTEFASYDFQETGLTEIEIPENITDMGTGTFRLCTSLEKVTVYSKTVNYASNCNVFQYCSSDLVVYGYSGSTTETYCNENNITFVALSESVEATSINLNKTSLELEVEDSETLVATISPDDVTDKTVTWTSSDEEVATVDSEGKVTAVAEGTATVTAKTSNGLTATCAVTVTDKKDVYFTYNKLTGVGYYIVVGDETDINVTLTGISSSEFANIVFTSSDTSIVEVVETDTNKSTVKIKALKAGSVTLSLSLNYNGTTYTDTYSLVVKDSISDYYYMVITGDNSIKIGDTVDLVATVYANLTLPSVYTDATSKSTWTSSDEDVATVDSKGTVTGINAGNSTITATYSFEEENRGEEVTVKYDYIVSVTGEEEKTVESITIKTEPTTTYTSGEALDLSDGVITVTYTDGTTEDISMTDEDVTVSGFNTLSLGTQTLTVSYGGAETTFKVNVEAAPADEEDKGQNTTNTTTTNSSSSEKTVNTGDNIVGFIIALVISLGAIIVISYIMNKKK